MGNLCGTALGGEVGSLCGTVGSLHGTVRSLGREGGSLVGTVSGCWVGQWGALVGQSKACVEQLGAWVG